MRQSRGFMCSFVHLCTECTALGRNYSQCAYGQETTALGCRHTVRQGTIVPPVWNYRGLKWHHSAVRYNPGLGKEKECIDVNELVTVVAWAIDVCRKDVEQGTTDTVKRRQAGT